MVRLVKKYITGYYIMRHIKSMEFYRLNFDMYLYNLDILIEDYNKMCFLKKTQLNIDMYRLYEKKKGLVKYT